MRIEHNIPALNSHRNLSRNQSAVAKQLEHLSSGYRIDRAADDAAGLAISEKMRNQLCSITQATSNAKDGISLIQTAEGALAEVHDMLDRLVSLAESSANGTYDDGTDRVQLQKELENICGEIDRIGNASNFNSVELFVGSEDTLSLTATRLDSSETLSLAQLLEDDGQGLKNIIYEETVFDFQTIQSADGTANDFSGDAEWTAAAALLESEIVPQAVQGILDTYPAFNYLTGSSIGIGLRLYSDPGSSTLASVSLASGGPPIFLSYSLSVNMGRTDLSSGSGRASLEQTICHEMIHAFMDEATTCGMLGISPSTSSGSAAAKFPKWFVEGMAQAASGPDNWIVAGLGIDRSSTLEDIGSKLASHPLSGSGSDTTAQYGTGYAACMYLGYLASGMSADMSDGASAAARLARGVSDTLQCLVSGASLDWTIDYVTDGRYDSVASFEDGFAEDRDAQAFIKSLLPYVTGSGLKGGGLIAGDLSSVDPLPNDPLSLDLFKLDTGSSSIKNTYPAGVTVYSGGALSESGTAPVSGIRIPKLFRGSQEGISLQIGVESWETISVPRFGLSVASLGLDRADVSTQTGALKSLEVIRTAVDTVSDMRGEYGALQNRLDHTINNLGSMHENIQSAESLIRDADIAEEMMKFTKSNILNQSAQSMLAQANQLPQGVLQLLGS